MIYFEKTTVGHLMEFVKNIRETDKIEVELLTGRKLENEPLESFMEIGGQTLMADGGIVLGLGGLTEKDNIIWFLSTKAIEDRKIEFLRFSRNLIDDLLKKHEFLWNFAYKHNKMYVDWLTWLGAEWSPCDENFDLFVFKRKE